MNITAPLKEVKEFWECYNCQKFNTKLEGNVAQEDYCLPRPPGCGFPRCNGCQTKPSSFCKGNSKVERLWEGKQDAWGCCKCGVLNIGQDDHCLGTGCEQPECGKCAKYRGCGKSRCRKCETSPFMSPGVTKKKGPDSFALHCLRFLQGRRGEE